MNAEELEQLKCDITKLEQLERDLISKFGWPWPLAKAVTDNAYSYTLCLRTGEKIDFSGARPCGLNCQWAELHDARPAGMDMSVPYEEWERGLVVRVADVVWCYDHAS